MSAAVIVAVSVAAALLGDAVLDRDQRRRWRARARAKRVSKFRRWADVDAEAVAIEACIQELQGRRLAHIRRGHMASAGEVDRQIDAYRAALKGLRQ